MIRKLLICAMLCVSQPALAEEDECDFDQAHQIRQMLALQKKYPGSRLIETDLLLIPVKEGEVRLGIGGCVHYGVSIELLTRSPERYRSEEALMQRALSLVKAYSQGIVDYERMSAAIRAKKWSKDTTEVRSYILKYDAISTFEIYQDDARGVIGVSFYQ